MKILLFNDNPVVRKLVALSAQKTKDDLTVVWSVEEIEESGYDLLIIDDALYSDETFEALKEAVKYKTTLLMATRGNAIPAGFEHVINKPFLPTDLVDLFARIDKDLGTKIPEKEADLKEDSVVPAAVEPFGGVGFEDEFESIGSDEDEAFMMDESEDEDVGLELSDLPSLDEEEEVQFPAVLDHEEVQEVRGLLEDAEEEFAEVEPAALEGIADFDFEELEIPQLEEKEEDADSFDFEALGLDEEGETEGLAAFEESLPSFSDEPDEEDAFDAMELGDDTALNEDELLLGEELLGDEKLLNEDELLLDEESLSDDALGALDLKIRQAIGNLESDDLDMELEGSESFDFEGLGLDEESEETEPTGADELSAPILDEFGEEEAFAAMESEDETALAEDEFSLPQTDELDEEEPLDTMDFGGDTALSEDEFLLDEELLGDDESLNVDALQESEPDEFDMELDEGVLEDLMAGDMELSDNAAAAEDFEGLEGFDELDMLDERELKLAIGEEIADESDIRVGGSEFVSLSAEALDEAMELASHVPAETAVHAKETPAEGVEALQTLLKALANEDVVKSLKGLNISININFGNDK